MSAARLFIKFDLAKSSLQNLTELFIVASREGAIRTCIVADANAVWKDGTHELTLKTHTLLNWAAIKVPGIDGTEIWLIPQTHQAQVEKRIGFEQKSVPLHEFDATLLENQSVRDPLHPGAELRIHFIRTPDLPTFSGVVIELKNAKDAVKPTSAALSRLKDQGNLAFST